MKHKCFAIKKLAKLKKKIKIPKGKIYAACTHIFSYSYYSRNTVCKIKKVIVNTFVIHLEYIANFICALISITD